MRWEIATIDGATLEYPTGFSDGTVWPRPRRIWAIGNTSILDKRLLGFFCSAKCPGEVILRTYDLARALRDAGVAVIGGFHSPMEKECLDLLLRGKQPIVICPARALQRMRIPSTWQDALKQERLLILSSFEEKHRQTTAELAGQRNRLVAMLATEVFVAHAGPGTKTERLCSELLANAKSVRVIDVPDNAHLVSRGAIPIQVDQAAGLAGNEPCR